MRSNGADAVLAMIPAMPPAAAWRPPMATAYILSVTEGTGLSDADAAANASGDGDGVAVAVAVAARWCIALLDAKHAGGSRGARRWRSPSKPARGGGAIAWRGASLPTIAVPYGQDSLQQAR